MILVDTSALIPYLRGRETAASALLERLVSEEVEIALTPEIVQEVLQGARDEKEWRTLKRYLVGQRVLAAADPLRSHVEAARIYYECRRRGLTVRSTSCTISGVSAISTSSDTSLSSSALAAVSRPLR